MALGLYLVLMPYAKDFSGAFPVNFGSRDWRFGAFGFLLNAGMLPVLGFGTLIVAALLERRVGALRAAGGAALAVAALTAVGFLVFRADGGQLASGVSENSAIMFRMASLKTTAAVILSVPALVILGVGALRAAGEILREDEPAVRPLVSMPG